MTSPNQALTFVGEKILRIPITKSTERHEDRVTRGESIATAHDADAYIDVEPSVGQWIKDTTPSGRDLLEFGKSLFPFIDWLPRYNRVWLMGDLVAGITVGCVVVPQGMAYAQLAQLPVQFGLYSSFVGVMLYWFFATSKDITIGPVAVMSLLVGDIVDEARTKAPDYAGHVVASALAVIVGSIVFALGFLRLGFIVDFIPLPAIAAFMTGSALSIAMGQIPALMGITGFSTRDATYKVFINTISHLGRSNLNAAIGLTALFALYTIRFSCNFAARKQPHRAKLWFFISTLRTAFIILLYTMISWLVNRNHRSAPLFRILGDVPRGFQNMGVPIINSEIISAFSNNIPVAVIVLLIEHIAISKSFGRINNYTINPSQELVAIGITNIFGAFFGAYPATGSFSRTAIKSKAGVRTPIAGVYTGILVLLAIYLLKAVFFYIPNAGLAAVIIHAVGDLITSPSTLYQFWRISPLEVFIYFAGVIVTVFTTIEIGIYVTVATSGALLLFRVAKADGEFLGRLSVTPIEGGARGNVYLPLNHADGSNPDVPVEQPHPGVFIFRFSASFLYPNAVHVTDQLTQYIFQATKRTNPQSFGKIGDRPWNDPGPRHVDPDAVANDPRPTLKAVIVDFSAVRNIDVSSTQVLVDVRKQLDRHASPDKVEWHFASVGNPWTKRALTSAGFGRAASGARAVFSVAEVGVPHDTSEEEQQERDDEEIARIASRPNRTRRDATGRRVAVLSTDYPAFHLTVDQAVASVVWGLAQSSFNSPSASFVEEKKNGESQSQTQTAASAASSSTP